MSEFPVTDLPRTDHPTEGDTAPRFTRPLVSSDFWEDVSLESLGASGPVVLVFYPMDGTGNAKYTWIEIQSITSG